MRNIFASLVIVATASAILAPAALASRWESSWPYDHTPAWDFRQPVDNYPYTGWDNPYPYDGYKGTYLNNFGFPRRNDVSGYYGIKRPHWSWY